MEQKQRPDKKPNILLAISDDQAWPHASCYGSNLVQTPAFDRIAREGVLFTHAYCPAPQCSPSRAALLTGMNIWQLEEAGTHASLFPAKFAVYPDILENIGYHVGYTGKPWAPGDWKSSGRTRNPAGPEYNRKKCMTPAKGIHSCDYASNFIDFLKHLPADTPFCFWYGCHEPHRPYELDSGLRAGKKLEDADVPDYLPDVPEIRSDLLDYALEIEWFDLHLSRMIDYLEKIGELDNTIIVVTSDNGMPFPRAKANNYENGIHVPLAIRWGNRCIGGRVIDDFVSHIDLAPTFLEAAGATAAPQMSGRSLMNILLSDQSGQVDSTRDHVCTGRERHTHARPDNLGYPIRSIRTHEYLYIWNLKPDLWPMGDPDGYYDVDDSPSKTYLLEHSTNDATRKLHDLAFGKRPAEELYHITQDPYCMNNVAEHPDYKKIKTRLRAKLEEVLTRQEDPRILGYGDVFDSYPRVSPMRPWLKGFAVQGDYNPAYMPESSVKKEPQPE